MEPISLFQNLSKEATLQEVSGRLSGDLKTVDVSPPITGLDKGSVDVDGTNQLLVPANQGRVRVDVFNVTDSRVWIGYNSPAVVGQGVYLDPGQCFYEYTTDDIYVMVEPSGAGIVTWQEWGA